jgi:hypothetical protein
MNRARVAAALVVSSLCAPGRAAAQTAAMTEGWVVLPVEEYRALRERANPPPPPPPAPPVDATLTRVDYDLRVDSDSISGRALLMIDVLKTGWTRVQIPAGLMVRDARLDGQPVSLVEGPPAHVLLARTGRSALTLDVVMPLTASAGTESIAFPPSPSPITRVALSMPKSGVDLAAAGGFVADRAETAAESRWIVYGRPNQPLTLSWRRKIDDRRAELPLRVRARLASFVGLGEDAGQVTTSVRVEVLQGLARDVALALPQGLAVNYVNGSTVADWEAGGGVLHVRLLEPAANEIAFVVQADMRTPRDGSIIVPLVRMPSAERESGGVAVDVVGAGEISGRQARGLEPADPSELGEVVASRESPSMVAFRLKPIAGAEPRSLAVTVVRYTPQAVLVANVEEARYRALASADGRLLVQARYAIRNNQRSFLKATLPPGATVWSAEVAGRPVRPGAAEGDAVLLPLEKGRAGIEAPFFAVDIVYLQRTRDWSDKGQAHIDLPALDLPVSRTVVQLHYSPRFEVKPLPGAFRAGADPGIFAVALRAPAPPPQPALSRDSQASSSLQELVDKFRNEPGGRTVIGSLPVHVTFPAFGPSIFLASELTAEGRAPSIDLAFKRTRS